MIKGYSITIFFLAPTILSENFVEYCVILLQDDFFCKFNIGLLVEYAQSTKDVVTLNHIFSLLSSAAKISSQWVSEHIFELFSVIGYSATRQVSNPSKKNLRGIFCLHLHQLV